MSTRQEFMPIRPYFASNASESELRKELAQLDVQLGIGTPGNERREPLKWVDEVRFRARRDEVKRLLNSIERGKRQEATMADKPWRRRGPVALKGPSKRYFEVVPESELSAAARASLAEQRAAVRDHKAAVALNRGEPTFALPTPYWVEH